MLSDVLIVVILRKTRTKQEDISMLLRLCDVHNVPLATNQKSAHILVAFFQNKN